MSDSLYPEIMIKPLYHKGLPSSYGTWHELEIKGKLYSNFICRVLSPRLGYKFETIPELVELYDFIGDIEYQEDGIYINNGSDVRAFLIPEIDYSECQEDNSSGTVNLYIGYGYTNIIESTSPDVPDIRNDIALWLFDYLFNRFDERFVVQSRLFKAYWLNK